MKTIEKTETYQAASEIVFQYLDDLGVTGMHMTQSSMMMGSKLNLEFLSENKKGPGTKYRLTGKMMGMKMDFTVAVTQWIAGVEKIWETLGTSQRIIYSWYRMHLKLSRKPEGTEAKLSISYERPVGIFYRIISFLFADWYCRWCLKSMLGDCEKLLKQREQSGQLEHAATIHN